MSQAPEVGSTANSYAILAKLATGGMAEIFLARNASGAGVERYVVLKRILRQRSHDATFVNMFIAEAKLAAQLQHPNIAQVYDTGMLGDSYFFTMEYVHGETVRELIHRATALRRTIPLSAALTIAAASAAALHHAHERFGLDGKPLGIVHRDVSPSNLMVSYEGNVKVVDFGVAKASHRSFETQSGTVKGKISYLSPEQCRGRGIDRRSDLFSLGIVLWELLVGDRLFKLGSDYENMQAIVKQPAPPPSALRPEIPPEIDAIVMKLLEKAPADRYQTADALLEEIEQVAVRAGMPLSAASLGRFVRDMFGQRPEPWVDMQVRAPNPEVTVTAEPVAISLDSTVRDMDEQLSQIPELSTITPMSAPLPLRAPVIFEFTTTPVLVHPRRRMIAIAVTAVAVVALGAVGMIAFSTRAAPEPAAASAPAVAPPAPPTPAVAPPPQPDLPRPAQPDQAVAPEPSGSPPPSEEPERPVRPPSKKTRVRPAKPEPRPDPKPLLKSEPKADVKPPPKPEPKADVKPPPKPESKPEIKTKAEPKKARDCDADPMACRR